MTPADFRRSAVRNRARFDQLDADNKAALRRLDGETLYSLTATLMEALDALEGKGPLAITRPVAELTVRLALVEVAQALNDRTESEVADA